jgi:hypothetical protein
VAYANAGLVGVLFGNTQVATYSDDDGGFLRLGAGAYYSAGPISLP